MKNYIYIAVLLLLLYNCSSAHKTMDSQTLHQSEISDSIANDTIKIANDSLEYEIIIIEPGFDAWLATQKSRGFYGINYLEQKNWRYVIEYNIRTRNPFRYNPNLYEQPIDYDPNIEYGYEVNYLLYNYFVYFQQHYRQKL